MATKLSIAGNTFLFTGKLTEFTREEAEAHVEAEGGKVLSGVSAKLNYLVVGEDAGSKLAKAEALGTVTILHEKEFLKMMNSVEIVNKPRATKKSTTKDSSKTSANKASSDKAYKEVQIGNQIWMTKNLDVAHFRNGDPIPEAKTPKDWKQAIKSKSPAFCFYENDNTNGAVYGVLYNWFAVSDNRGLAPDGWGVPTDEDWTVLTRFFGKEPALMIKNSDGWKLDGNGLKKSMFQAMPGGTRQDNGTFWGVGIFAPWWCSGSKWFPDQLWFHCVESEDTEVGRSPASDESGYAVRCIRL